MNTNKSGTKRSGNGQFMSNYMYNIQDHVFSHQNDGGDQYEYNIEGININSLASAGYSNISNGKFSIDLSVLSIAIGHSPSDMKASVPEARTSFGKPNETPQFTKTNMSNLSFKNSRKQNKNTYFGSSTVNDEIEEENEIDEEAKDSYNSHIK